MCDELITNCDLIQEFCLQNDSDQNKRLINDCERLVGSAKFVAKIADEYKFETLASNGFVQFLRIATVFTGQLLRQIKTKNKVEADFARLFRSFFSIGDYLVYIHDKLKEERNAFFGADKSSGHFMIKERNLSRRRMYDGLQ